MTLGRIERGDVRVLMDFGRVFEREYWKSWMVERGLMVDG